MQHRTLYWLAAICIVLIVAQDAAAWPRHCHRRCPCPSQSPSLANTPALPVEVEQTLKQLRIHFSGKTDDQIIQVLRGYVLNDDSTEKDAIRWLAERLERAKRQRVAVEAITKQLYGKVRYNYQVDVSGNDLPSIDAWGNDLQSARLPGPAWLRNLVGEDLLADVAVVWLWDSNGTDAAMAHLEVLPHLLELHLPATRVSDIGLKYFRGLMQLRRLCLGFTGVTHAGLVHLQGMSNLQHLELTSTKVTDAGLEHLEGLSQLQWLNLRSTQVIGTGLKHLERLPNLEVLDLDDTPITDAELENLKGLKHLGQLSLCDTKVTHEGVKKLQQALPTCAIFWWQPTPPAR